MKKVSISIVVFLIAATGFAQQIGEGLALPYLSNLGAVLKSGVYSMLPAATGKVPYSTDEWNHLFVIRHGNTANNNQLQIASSFTENDKLFFRKISDAYGMAKNPQWIEIATRGNNNFVGNQIIDGNVGIGITNPTNKLDVNGTIHSKEVKIDMEGWSDFVFKKEYILPTLEEVENHIKEKGHLENIPSEEEVLKNGINLGEMNAKLLQKIEELTLYSIQQSKEIEALKEENKSFKTLSQRLSMIEEKIK